MEKNKDLYLEYARVIKMCEGTPVKPWRCVKYKGDLIFTEHPALLTSFDSRNYDFAVAIIEDTPVFVGDTVYYKHNYHPEHIVTMDGYLVGGEHGYYNWGAINKYDWTLKPPKKNNVATIRVIGTENKSYFFTDKSQKERFEKAIESLFLG